jgi:hypothetical protein
MVVGLGSANVWLIFFGYRCPRGRTLALWGDSPSNYGGKEVRLVLIAIAILGKRLYLHSWPVKPDG